MYLENIVIDARDAHRLGRFWAALLGTTTLTDTTEAFETRMAVAGDAYLDLCFSAVREPRDPAPRLHLDIAGGARQDEVVGRALRLGAAHLDIGQGDVPWVVLADPEANPFCVMESRPEYEVLGPIAALPLDSADIERDTRFWSELSGWVAAPSSMPSALRHPSGRGPLLELCPEPRAKRADEKNRVHLDVRLEAGDDQAEALTRLHDLGGCEVVDHGWGELPWRVCQDPSGNDVCLLPAPSSRSGAT
ncbi:MAG: VOC family protein [Phycicoccus sp.]